MLKVKQFGNEYIVSFFNVKRFNIIICDKIKGYLVQFVKEPGNRLVLNMGDITFIDSCGFESLLDIMSAAKKNGSSVLFIHVSVEVKELINLVHLSEKFEIA